jgi:hypothetical protein
LSAGEWKKYEMGSQNYVVNENDAYKNLPDGKTKLTLEAPLPSSVSGCDTSLLN